MHEKRGLGGRAVGQGLIALVAGIALALLMEAVVMFMPIPYYLAGAMWGLFPTLILFNRRHWSNKLAFGLIYMGLVAFALPHFYFYFAPPLAS